MKFLFQGESVNIMFSQQMAQALLAGADVLTCIHTLLINIFGINLNEISISGRECNIMFSQQMAQALLAGADVLKCIHTSPHRQFLI